MREFNCACKSRDPFECWAARYKHEDPISGDRILDHARVEDEGGPCECQCHDHDYQDEDFGL